MSDAHEWGSACFWLIGWPTERRLGLWAQRRLMVFGLLLLLPITCLGMCMVLWRRLRWLSTCFTMGKLRSRHGAMQFVRRMRSGATCAGFWMQQQRTRLS